MSIFMKKLKKNQMLPNSTMFMYDVAGDVRSMGPGLIFDLQHYFGCHGNQKSAMSGPKSSKFHQKINFLRFQPYSHSLYLGMWEPWNWGRFLIYSIILVAMATKNQPSLGQKHKNFIKKSTSTDFNHFHMVCT